MGGQPAWDEYDELKRPYCLIRGHDMVDDGFMGNGELCRRCGAWTSFNMIDREALLRAILIGGIAWSIVVLISIGLSVVIA